MTHAPHFLTDHLGEMRQQVLERIAALLESQTRTRLFAASVTELTRDIHAELLTALQDAIKGVAAARISPVERQGIFDRLEAAAENCARLDLAVELLLEERWRQWARNAQDQQDVMLEFNRMANDLAGTLIEKDLLERGSRVLERIVLSREKVTQWKAFIQEVLLGFYEFFAFDIFFIIFRDNGETSLYIYYMGDYPEPDKRAVRDWLTRETSARLEQSSDASLNVEEFQVLGAGGQIKLKMEAIRMISVPVLDLSASGAAGLLGIAYASVEALTPQENSVLHSILSVMVMVVGSSKVLGSALAELEYHSTHDPLTGLHNRRYFDQLLDDEMGRSERYQRTFAVLLVDLDDFKDINDTYGHPSGDGVLKLVADIMLRVTRKGDVVSRIGGDEFAILLVETGAEGAMAVAEKLRTELRQKSCAGESGRSFHVTASIGVVTYPEDAKSVSDLMAGVDLGLYRAKEIGKDAVSTLSSVKETLELSRAKRDYAETLRVALREGRVVPYYQTIYNCRTRLPFAFESLARIIEPDGKVLTAGMFIETVEKYGLGREFDHIIINQALMAAKLRLEQSTEPFRLFINLSAQEIEGRGMLGYAEQRCVELGIPPHVIVFEILERDAIGDMDHMRQFLTELKKKGFLFALDDFGSGYNSFHYLRELSFDFVKIDGEFVKNILHSSVDRTLVRNLIRLCQELGILTVAEFVENEEILEAVRSMGVDYAQGFHLARPTPQMC